MSRFPLGSMLSVVFLGFIAYRIVLVGSGELLYRLSPEKINGALLNTSSLHFKSDVYYALAETALEQGEARAAELFTLNALRINNTNGRAMALAIEIYGALGEKDKQSEAVALTSKLWKSHLFARSKLAKYWAEKGDRVKLMEEWNILLLQDKNLEKVFFPLMLTYLEQPSQQKILQPYLSSPPKWWNRFFSFASKRSVSHDSLEWLYEARKASGNPLRPVEYRSYIKRLVADNQWQRAFQIWKELITSENRDYNSYVYDGGFEHIDIGSNRTTVFDWKVLSANKWIKFDSRLAFGADKKALGLEFLHTKEKIKFKHLSQVLVLDKNESYKATFKVRTGGIKEDSDLLWKVYCLGEKRSLIGESPLIIKSAKWKKLTFSFKTPATNCQRQLLRLESQSLLKSHLKGRFWFDDVEILKVSL